MTQSCGGTQVRDFSGIVRKGMKYRRGLGAKSARLSHCNVIRKRSGAGACIYLPICTFYFRRMEEYSPTYHTWNTFVL